MQISTVRDLITEISESFGRHDAPSYAAAIAFHAIISIVPILLVSIGIAERFFGEDQAMQQVVDTVEQFVGMSVASVIDDLVQQQMPNSMDNAVFALFAAIITLYSASNVFRQLVIALNAIWDVDQPTVGIEQGIMRWTLTRLRKHILGFVMAIAIILSLLAPLILSFFVSFFTEMQQEYMPLVSTLLTLFNLIGLPILLILFCSLIFKVLPNTQIVWNDVWLGAVVTGVVLAIGQSIIGFYVSHSRIPNYYGVAGSVVILMLWAYISAYILLVGAEFTHVFAHRYGSQSNNPQPVTSD